jgi:hypothetical protein
MKIFDIKEENVYHVIFAPLEVRNREGSKEIFIIRLVLK